MILWRFTLTDETVELRAPSEGEALRALLAMRPGAVVTETVRRWTARAPGGLR